MTAEYRRGYEDALHYASGVALAFERLSRNDLERRVCQEFSREIEAYLEEMQAAAGSGQSADSRRAQLLSAAPELLTTLKSLLAAVEQGIEVNPGLLLKYRYVVERAEGSEQ